MRAYALKHLSDATLLHDLATLVARDRTTTAELLAHIAEVEERRLYLPAGYTSMHAYCVEELQLSDDAAAKRIHVARKARDFPVLYSALADGRIHLTGLRLLAPHLTHENVDELVAAATHRRKSEIERLIAERFPQRDVPTVLRPLASGQHAPGHVEKCATEHAPGHAAVPAPALLGASAPAQVEVGSAECLGEHAPGHVEERTSEHAPGHAAAPLVRPARVAPLSPERFALQVTITGLTHDKLRHAQALLSHAVPSGDVAEVLDRALDALICGLEKRKFGATRAPRTRPQKSSPRTRHIPAQVRRAVWERDQGQCTFVGRSGHRCGARTRLEFDHIEPVARGGKATVGGMRLRCRAHNQYEADRAFGAEFMRQKRDAARRAALKLNSERPSLQSSGGSA